MAHTNLTQQTADRSSTPDSARGQQTQSGARSSTPLLLQRAYADPSSLTATDVKHLQRTIGNRAVIGLLSKSTGLQAKLKLGPAGDQYEQEADHVAQQVVRQMDRPQNVQRESIQEKDELAQAKPLSASISSLQRTLVRPTADVRLQRQELEEEELQAKRLSQNSSPVQRSPDSRPQMGFVIRRQEQEEDELQMKPMHGPEGGAVEQSVEKQIQTARGGGKPLDDNVRGSMEQGFGADFSGVRVHTGGQADALNRSLNAKAFTVGNDVFFGKGQYNPGSSGGKQLLAHELTHTVQQNGIERPLISREILNQESKPAAIQRLWSEKEFRKKTTAFGKFRKNSPIIGIDEKLREYNEMGYDNLLKLASLNGLQDACDHYLISGKRTGRRRGVETLKAQIVSERPIVEILNRVINTQETVQKVIFLREATDLRSKKGDMWTLTGAQETPSTAMQREQGLILDEVANKGVDGMAVRDVESLRQLSLNEQTPEIIRNMLSQVLDNGLGNADVKAHTRSGARKNPGQKVTAGYDLFRGDSTTVLGSLAHEITHAMVDNTFKNDFMMSITFQGEKYLVNEVNHRYDLWKSMNDAVQDLNGVLSESQIEDIKSQLGYMNQADKFGRYVTAEETGQKKAKEEGEKDNEELGKKYNTSKGRTDLWRERMNNPVLKDKLTLLVEYDAVMTQLLFTLHKWKVPDTNHFAEAVGKAAKDLYEYRKAVIDGDPYGGRKWVDEQDKNHDD